MKSLHPKEPAIIWAIERSPGVRKVETLGIKWTGPQPRQLMLRPSTYAGMVEFVVAGTLFIGSGMRYLTICPETGVGLEALSQKLAVTLGKYKVEVQPKGEGEKMETTMDAQQMHTVEYAQPVLTPEQRWAYCEVIAAGVKTVKGFEEEEMGLELQLEELRGKKQHTQQQTLDILAQLLGH